tara:strand:+ start:267 stop:449 length:183 start_codon:yes stop_codon:yes gene_type:complete
MLVLYTEEQLGAAYQIYARAQADGDLGILAFEEFRKMFEFQFLAMLDPGMVFGEEKNTTH